MTRCECCQLLLADSCLASPMTCHFICFRALSTSIILLSSFNVLVFKVPTYKWVDALKQPRYSRGFLAPSLLLWDPSAAVEGKGGVPRTEGHGIVVLVMMIEGLAMNRSRWPDVLSGDRYPILGIGRYRCPPFVDPPLPVLS